MPARLNPYLTFQRNAREAMEFYRSVFGGDLTINTFAEYGGAPEGFPDDGVMHAMLTTPAGFVIMASDGGTEAPAPGAITMSLSGTERGLREYWQQLSDGGEVTMPLEKQMWGDEFGMCTDRFGVHWMVNISAD